MLLVTLKPQFKVKEEQKLIKRNYMLKKGSGSGDDDDHDKDRWRKLFDDSKNITTVEEEETVEDDVTRETTSESLQVENLTEDTDLLISATNDLESSININMDSMNAQYSNLSANTNEVMEQTSTLNEQMLQNITEKTNSIMANYIELANKVDILIQNSNRSILNDLYTFFVNFITNWNYIMIGGGVFIIVIAGIGSFMYLKGNRGNYVQVSPLLTEQSQILTQQTMSLIAQSQAVSNSMLSQQNHLLAQQTEREPQRRFWRSLGNLILQILEEWLEGMKERRQHGRKDFK